MQLQTEFESLIAKAKVNATIEQDAQEVRAKYGPMFTPAGIETLDSIGIVETSLRISLS